MLTWLRKVDRIFTDNNASRLYEAVLVYLQHDVLEIKQKNNNSKSKYFIVLIMQRTRYFILRAVITIKNVGL